MIGDVLVGGGGGGGGTFVAVEEPSDEAEKEETKETIHYNFNYEANLTEEDLVSLQSAIESSLEAGKRCR